MSDDLFPPPSSGARRAPLADRMRPARLQDFVGQKMTAPGSLFIRSIEADQLPSMILWGPPGSGKTTIARLVAGVTSKPFVTFSAVLSGVKEVRTVVAAAKAHRDEGGAATILFVDEIHRFNRAQQDAFLPHVEDGTLVLIGATTENPSFHVNAALLSRCLVFTLDPLGEDALLIIARRALGDPGQGLDPGALEFSDEVLGMIARLSHGDARSLLNRLETLVAALRAGGRDSGSVTAAEIEKLVARKLPSHDRDGDEHFNLISALHKAVRGGDPQGALYWLGRMIVGGEDPLYILRRLVRMAVEDVGLADPRALEVARGAVEAYRFLGSPEGDLALAQCAVYLATAPKSNAVYSAWGEVCQAVRDGAVHPVPHHIRNAPTRLMKQLGYGKGYVYPHDFDAAITDQDYLPSELRGRAWYRPSPYGYEKEIERRIGRWREILDERRHEGKETR